MRCSLFRVSWYLFGGFGARRPSLLGVSWAVQMEVIMESLMRMQLDVFVRPCTHSPRLLVSLFVRTRRDADGYQQSCQVELNVMREISLLQYVKRGRNICKTQSALPEVAKQPRMLGRSGGMLPPPEKKLELRMPNT